MKALLIQPDDADAETLWPLLAARGFDVSYAWNAASALRSVLEFGLTPDVIFVAVVLPDMEMRDLAHQLHERLGPVLFVTTEVEGRDAPTVGKVLGRADFTPEGVAKVLEGRP